MASASTIPRFYFQRDFPMELVHLIGMFLDTADVFMMFSLCKTFALHTKKHPIQFTEKQSIGTLFLVPYFDIVYRAAFMEQPKQINRMRRFRIRTIHGYNRTFALAIPHASQKEKALDAFSTIKYVQTTSHFNDSLNTMRGLWPPNMKYLDLGNKFNQIITKGDLPSGLETLVIGNSFNYYFTNNALVGIKELVLGYCFNNPFSINQTDNNNIPEGMVSITMGGCYQHPLLKGQFPSTLRGLKFHETYNEPLGVGILPDSLEVLHWGMGTIEPGAIPTGLKVLKFGEYFKSRDLKPGVLPNASTLKCLMLGCDFVNETIYKGCIPDHLDRLVLTRNPYKNPYQQWIEFEEFPIGLKSLELDCGANIHKMNMTKLYGDNLSRHVQVRLACPPMDGKEEERFVAF
jgi:hypothetical protein